MSSEANRNPSTSGSLEGIIPLSEGSFTIDKTKLFVPFDQLTDDLQQRPVGSLLVEIQPFVIVTTKDILLLDTGLGFSDTGEGKMQLHTNLERAGIKPEQVTKVLVSHLHKDHAGGISLENNHARLSLPNAVYYVQKRELDFALAKGLPSYIPEEIIALRNSQQVVFLDKDEGTIDGYIRFRHTGAHSPHHQVFWIGHGDRLIFFGGDDAPQLQQMKVRYKTKYDFDPEKAMQLRQQWWKQGNEEGWTFLFYHDIKSPAHGPLSLSVNKDNDLSFQA
jgi:glyoxylase-like metal-dependent hydrolase (beta-lactamase superfamily II)